MHAMSTPALSAYDDFCDFGPDDDGSSVGTGADRSVVVHAPGVNGVAPHPSKSSVGSRAGPAAAAAAVAAVPSVGTPGGGDKRRWGGPMVPATPQPLGRPAARDLAFMCHVITAMATATIGFCAFAERQCQVRDRGVLGGAGWLCRGLLASFPVGACFSHALIACFGTLSVVSSGSFQ